MESLKKAIVMPADGEFVIVSYLPNDEFIRILVNYFYQHKDFPRLSINLNTWSHSIEDYKHKKIIKEKKMNEYEIEIYKFNNMLDEYYIKFNAQPLNLSKANIENYYKKYFGVDLFDQNKNLTQDIYNISYDYIEGILWVFNYYFNDISYVNKWYYVHERAPLLIHVSTFLEKINSSEFMNMYSNLEKYHVDDLSKFFNPLEQLIYVSPITNDFLKLLPLNYKKYMLSDSLDPFLKTFFVNVNTIVDKLWNEKIATDVDCHGIIFLNKCIIEQIYKPTDSEDMQFLRAIRRVPPMEISKKRSKSIEPPY